MANLLEHPRAALFRAPAQEAETARQAQRSWSALPLAARLRVLRGLRHRIAARAPELAAAAGAAPVSGNLPGNGRPLAEVLSAEVLPLADACLFLEREAPRLLAPRKLGRSGRPSWLGRVTAEVRREPLGLVLVLAPSNYPLFLPGVQTLQALAAGNAVLWKPSPGGVQAARALVGLLVEAGLDERLVRVLPATDDSGRAAIAAEPDRVLLTGSAATGRAVLRDLADRLIPATLELSGCDALFVLPGADLGRVARAVRFGLTLNEGATCIAPRRLFVPRGLTRNLEELLATALADIPPVRIEEESAARIRSLVRGALARGARLLGGGASSPSGESFGNPEAFRPLVVLDATPDLPLLREDLFAPVLSVVPVASVEEALDFAARCPYALGASVFGPEEAARALATRVRAGVVTVNDLIVPTADPRIPFGGRGESGFGVTRGAEGLLELTTMKTVAVRHGRWLPHLEPRAEEDGEILRGLLDLAHAARWQDRLAAAASLVRAAARRARSAPRSSPSGNPTHPSREET
jgi:acyl-CoA reductase-like NAD-dependent aldehyde dehydrogenase